MLTYIYLRCRPARPREGTCASTFDQGRDLIAWHDGEKWAFQCKRVKQFGPKDALEEAQKVLALP